MVRSMSIQRLTKFESLWSLWNLVRDHWDKIITFALGGGGMTYLVWITDWINAYGPAAWGVAFFVGAYAALGLLAVWQRITSRQFINKQAEISLSREGVNPRAKRFEKQKIPLGEFYSPFYFPHHNKEFIDCDIAGPSMLALMGSTMSDVEFRHCQIVIIRDGITLWGVTAFMNSRIFGGTMANVTLLMTRDQYNHLPEDVRNNVPVIHEIAN